MAKYYLYEYWNAYKIIEVEADSEEEVISKYDKGEYDDELNNTRVQISEVEDIYVDLADY